MTQWRHIVHEAATEADRRCDGKVPWRDSYADVFPDQDALRRALSFYWRQQVAGYVNERRYGCEPAYRGSDRSLSELADQHRGLLMVVYGGGRLAPPWDEDSADVLTRLRAGGASG
jgi:hypothetical protein